MPYSSKATNNKSTWYRGHGHYSKQKVPEFLQPNFSGRSLFSSAPEKTFFFFSTKSFTFFLQVHFNFFPSTSILYMKKEQCIPVWNLNVYGAGLHHFSLFVGTRC